MIKINIQQYFFLFILVTLSSCHNNNDTTLPPIDYVALLNKSPDNEIEIISCDKPYEKELSFPTIITLPDRYIMYYIVYNGLGVRGFSTCYAESTDGINWTKPNLGLVEYGGNKNNNIISNDFEGVCVEYHDGVFYLLTYAADFHTYLYTSTDGKIFTKSETFKVPHCCDSQNQIIWDKNKNHFKVYLRSWYKSENKSIKYNHTDSLYRAVSLLSTNHPQTIQLPLADNPLWRWGKDSGIPPALSSELRIVMKNTSNDDYDIYNSCVHQYNDGTIIAYPILYWHLPEPPQGGASYNDGYTKLGLYSSNDGVNFKVVNDDYMQLGDIYFEFAIGHIETDKQIKHYYVKFSTTHGDAEWDSNTKIIARIHNK